MHRRCDASDWSRDMANKTYTLDVRKIGEQYEITIPEIEATATGATFDEAVENAQRAIIQSHSSKKTKVCANWAYRCIVIGSRQFSAQGEVAPGSQ